MSIAIELPQAQEKRLRELAATLGVSLSEAAALILGDGLSALDADFASAAKTGLREERRALQTTQLRRRQLLVSR